MMRSSEFESAESILRKYRSLLENKKIEVKDLPPCIKLVDGLNDIIFVYALHDVKHLKCIIPMEDQNLFRSQHFPLLDCNIHDEELLKEIRFVSNLRNNRFYMHQLKFYIDENKNLMANYAIERKDITEGAGRALRKLPWAVPKKDENIEQMVNMMKALLAPELTFSIVKGEAIRDWYHQKRYANTSGTLSNSCMRYSSCQDYMDVYTDNDTKMLIATDSDGKLRGRALLWPRSMWNKNYFDDADYIMDRIYGSEVTITRFKTYAEDKNWIYKKHQNYSDNRTFMYKNSEHGYIETDKRMRMNIKHGEYPTWPYIDTFNTMEWDSSSAGLKNYGDGEMLTNTDGSTSERFNLECCDCGGSIERDNERYIDDEIYCDECVTWSEYDDRDYRNEYVTYSEVLGMYIHNDDAIEITHGPNREEYTHYDEASNCYENDESFIPCSQMANFSNAPIEFHVEDKLCTIQIKTVQLIDNEEQRARTYIQGSEVPLLISNRECFQRERMGNFQYNYSIDAVRLSSNVTMVCSTSSDYDMYCWSKIYHYLYALWCKYGIAEITVCWDNETTSMVIDSENYIDFQDKISRGDLEIGLYDDRYKIQEMFEKDMIGFNTTMCALTPEYQLNILTSEEIQEA